MSNNLNSSKTSNSYEYKPFQLTTPEDSKMWNSLSTDEKLLRVQNKTDKYQSEQQTKSTPEVLGLQKLKNNLQPYNTLQSSQNTDSVAQLSQTPIELEQLHMNKIHELELKKSDHINTINNITNVIKNQEQEKVLLQNKYEQEINTVKNDDGCKNRYYDHCIQSARKEHDCADDVLNHAMSEYAQNAYNINTARQQFKPYYSDRLQLNENQQLEKIDYLSHDKSIKSKNIDYLEQEKLTQHINNEQKIQDLEECKAKAMIDKVEVMHKLENDLLIETEKKVIKEDMIEDIACDIRKTTDTQSQSRNYDNELFNNVKKAHGDNVIKKLDFKSINNTPIKQDTTYNANKFYQLNKV